MGDSGLGRAIEREDWEAAALWLAVALVEEALAVAAGGMAPVVDSEVGEPVDALLDVLGGEDESWSRSGETLRGAGRSRRMREAT